MTAPSPARTLGVVDAACVVIGAIIGVGIFFNPSGVASLTTSGPLALASWALAGLIALCGGLTFAALGTRYHANGAQYDLLRDAYGPLPAFLFVFCNATAIQAGAIGVIALVCVRNLAAAAGLDALRPAASLSASLLLVALVTGTNVLGVRWGARLQNLTVAAKLAAILCIVALGLYVTASPQPTPHAPLPPDAAPLPGFSGVLAGLVPAFFAFGGWQHSLWISGEVKDPVRTLPRAILLGVLIVIAVYLAVNWAYLALLGHGGVAASKALAADAADAVLPAWARRAIAAAVAVSALGVLNAQLLSGPRLIFGMARDGRFFAPFARLHPRLGTPHAAIVLLGAAGAALLLLVGADGINTLTAGAVFVDSVFFVLTGAALLLLHQRTPGPLLPGSLPAAAVFVLGEIGVIVGVALAPNARVAALGGLAWIAGAACLYFSCFRSRGRPASTV